MSSPASVGDAEFLRSAFRELHGPRLHGFALLVALGDARRAERAAAQALAAGAKQVDILRHPERAAAWLRARTLRDLQGRQWLGGGPSPDVRRNVLATLGTDAPAFAGMSALSPRERAALVVTAVERFDPIDVETILGASPSATRKAVTRARSRYLEAVLRLPEGETTLVAGALSQRVREVVDRALGNMADPEPGPVQRRRRTRDRSAQ